MKTTVFWDVAPCSQVEIDRHLRAAYCLHHQGVMMTFITLTMKAKSSFQSGELNTFGNEHDYVHLV
jgi:hypothetical protein